MLRNKRKTMLIIDDYADDCIKRICPNVLQEYEIIGIAKNCDQSLRVIQTHRPDAIIVLKRIDVSPLMRLVCNNVDYCPDIHITSSSRFLNLLRENRSTWSYTQKNKCVEDYLINVGVPAQNKGFYLLSAALEECDDNGMMSMTKQLYPMLADRSGSTGTAVEKNIRDSIKICNKRKTDLYQRVFYSVQDMRITNSVFIKYSSRFLFGDK